MLSYNVLNSDYTIVYDRNICEIRYTTTDGSILTPKLKNITMLSNTYENGVGIALYATPICEISDSAYNDTSLVTIELPHTVTSIGKEAFDGCSNLTSVKIPNSVTSIGMEAFCYCKNLTSVTIPDSVTSIEEGTFNSCSNLKSVIIGNRVTEIGDAAFSECSSLTNITIPNSVTSIGQGAFSHCSNLTSIVIPKMVTEIGYSAFVNCGNLTSVYCMPTTPPQAHSGTSTFSDNSTIYVPRESFANYKGKWYNCDHLIQPYDFE